MCRSWWVRAWVSVHAAEFYEKSGAIRDIVQNHIMQVLCLTAMEPPVAFDAEAIRDEKVKVLRAIPTLMSLSMLLIV